MPRLTEADLFRHELTALAAAKDWPAWEQARLIFADWLDDRGDPEAAALRARWSLAYDAPQCCVWSAILDGPYPVSVRGQLHRRLKGAFDARPLAHFEPWTLEYRTDHAGDESGYTFFHWPNREPWRDPYTGRRVYHPLAERVLPGGLLALFGPVPQPAVQTLF